MSVPECGDTMKSDIQRLVEFTRSSPIVLHMDGLVKWDRESGHYQITDEGRKLLVYRASR